MLLNKFHSFSFKYKKKKEAKIFEKKLNSTGKLQVLFIRLIIFFLLFLTFFLFVSGI